MSNALRPRSQQRGAIAWGTTWGVGFGLIEVVTVSPLQEGDLVEHVVWWLLYWLMPYWCLVGYLLVRLADSRERLGGRLGQSAAFAAIVLISATVQPALVMGISQLTLALMPALAAYAPHALTVAPTLDTWSNIALYNVWITLFYGGMLMAARIFTVRAEHIRSLLYSNAMVRSRTEALLDAERLQALQSQIDPSLLLDSMQALEQRYRLAPARAERLLEALVDFLRVAMQGLRAPVSSVEAEIKLARAFAQLQRERDLRGAWRVVEEPPRDADGPDMASLRFPSLLMLPLLALGGENGRPLLRARSEGGRTVISLHGLSAQVPAELGQTIRARLSVLYGEHFSLDSGSSGAHRLDITLQEPPTSRGESLHATIPR
jgi:hypothetical protein